MNYELFRTFALFFNDLYEIRRSFPDYSGRFGSFGAPAGALHDDQRPVAPALYYYNNRCIALRLGAETREPVLG